MFLLWFITGRSPSNFHDGNPSQQSDQNGSCKARLNWDKQPNSKHSLASVSARTHQRDIKQMMSAIDQALGPKAGADRKLYALYQCTRKIQQQLGMDDLEYIGTMLCPEYEEYMSNVREAFDILNKSTSNEARTAKIALASGLLNEDSNKARAMKMLGVSRRTCDLAIQHKMSFSQADSAHQAAKNLMPAQRWVECCADKLL